VLVGSTGTTPNHYLYCGEQYDEALGFYYLRARYLNPQTGRFWTMDTDEGDPEEPNSLQKFLYCEGDPVQGIDPTGNLAEEPLVTAALGQSAEGVGGAVGAIVVRNTAIQTLAKVAIVAAVSTMPATETGPEPIFPPRPPIVIPPDWDERPNQNVVRGGVATAEQLIRGTKALDPARYNGISSGFSVQSAPGKSVQELAKGGRFRNGQISVTTTRALFAAGLVVQYAVFVVPTASDTTENHCTVTVPSPLPGVLAHALSAAFVPMPNPYPY
jgi:RHS repeat-associated protein